MELRSTCMHDLRANLTSKAPMEIFFPCRPGQPKDSIGLIRGLIEARQVVHGQLYATSVAQTKGPNCTMTEAKAALINNRWSECKLRGLDPEMNCIHDRSRQPVDVACPPISELIHYGLTAGEAISDLWQDIFQPPGWTDVVVL